MKLALALAVFVWPALALAQPAQWNYQFVGGVATATYPGQVTIPQLGGASAGCVQADGFGNLSATGAACGGGGGSGITQLTGDVLAGPGTGSQAATLATSGVTAGTYTDATVTVDAKGRVTSATSGAGGTVTVSGTPTTGHVATFNAATVIQDGGALGTAAFVNTGSAGGVVPLLNLGVTFSGNDTFSGLVMFSNRANIAHIGAQNTTSISSGCGTGSTLTAQSGDVGGQVNVGTGTATSCVLTFGAAYTVVAPFCLVQDVTTNVFTTVSTTMTALTMTSAGWTSGDKLNYICTGK